MQIGYCGLVIEEDGFWQGFFLDDRCAKGGRELINQARDKTSGGQSTIQVKPGDIQIPEAGLVNIIAATFSTIARSTRGYPYLSDANIPGSGDMIWAIHELSGINYFQINARASRLRVPRQSDLKPPEIGTLTEIVALDARSIDHAREMIDASPEVQRCKQKVLRNKRR